MLRIVHLHTIVLMLVSCVMFSWDAAMGAGTPTFGSSPNSSPSYGGGKGAGASPQQTQRLGETATSAIPEYSDSETFVPRPTFPPGYGLPPGVPANDLNLDEVSSPNGGGPIARSATATSSGCGPYPGLQGVGRGADIVTVVHEISNAAKMYIKRCRNPSQAQVANVLDKYAAALRSLADRLGSHLPGARPGQPRYEPRQQGNRSTGEIQIKPAVRTIRNRSTLGLPRTVTGARDLREPSTAAPKTTERKRTLRNRSTLVEQRLAPVLRNLASLVSAAAQRIRVAPTKRIAANALLRVVAQVQKQISLVRVENPDETAPAMSIGNDVAGVLRAAAFKLARAEGI